MMKNFLSYSVLLGFSLINTSTALTPEQRTHENDLTEIATGRCDTEQIEGSDYLIKLLADGKLSVSFFRKNGSALEGTFVYEKSEWEGHQKVLREHQARENSERRKCIEKEVSSLKKSYTQPINKVKIQPISIETILPPEEKFQDDFEQSLRNWIVKKYDSYYNNSVQWHRTSKVYASGKYALSIGHKDTDQKDNTRRVLIETKNHFSFDNDTILSFKIKKSHNAILEIFLSKINSSLKEKIGFHPGSEAYSDWKSVQISLNEYAKNNQYRLVFEAYNTGEIYLDDIIIQN